MTSVQLTELYLERIDALNKRGPGLNAVTQLNKDALAEAAHFDWLRARGMQRMVGPADFSLNDESGIVVEGFELRPMVRQPWHPPYYQRLCEAAGLTKAMDLLSWDLSIDNRAGINPILPKIADRARDKYGVTIRKMRRLHASPPRTIWPGSGNR